MSNTTKREYFGTDGIRGRVGKSPVSVDFMLQLGWAFGQVLRQTKRAKVLIGRDTRSSGVILESALQAGLSAAGVDILLAGVLPTPAVAYLTHSQRATAGIMITASHNPYYDNGVKFFDSRGRKLADATELNIEAQLQQPLQMISTDELGVVEYMSDAPSRYIEFCKSVFPNSLSLGGLKIVIDCANGATFDVAPKVFNELGAENTILSSHPNGKNINVKCGATDVKALQQCVVDQGADLGLAFDGDGDRLIMVDHQGEVVDGDQILCILAKDLNTGVHSKSGVVGTLMSNLGLEQAMNKAGIDFVRANVGDRYVLEQLQAHDWVLGGESSGHIVNLDYTSTGDGIISALQVLRIMQMSGLSLFELKQQMTKQPQVMINVPVFGLVNVEDYPDLIDKIKQAEADLGARGRILVRPSGTEPCVRVMVEGEDEAEIRQVASALAKSVEALMT